MQREESERFCGVTMTRKMIRAKTYDANGIQMNKTVALYTKLNMSKKKVYKNSTG